MFPPSLLRYREPQFLSIFFETAVYVNGEVIKPSLKVIFDS